VFSTNLPWSFERRTGAGRARRLFKEVRCGQLESILCLDATSRGVYIVSTASGARHLIDLDRMAICRITPARLNGVSQLRRDTEEIDLEELISCRVGDSMRLLVQLHLPGVIATARRSTRVISIERLERDLDLEALE
jgi:hypothetical protein